MKDITKLYIIMACVVVCYTNNISTKFNASCVNNKHDTK
jgi:hypothetical protein